MSIRYTGKDLVVIWAYSGGSVSLESEFRTFSTSESGDHADASAGNDTYRDKLPTLADASAQYDGLDTNDATGTTNWDAVQLHQAGTLYWYPLGTASAKPKHSAAAFVNQRDREFPYDDVVTITVGWELTEEPTMAAVA